MRKRVLGWPLAWANAALLALATCAWANDDELVFTDMLNNGWQNWGYGSTLNFANTSPVLAPWTNSISASMPAWTKIWFLHDPINATLYSSFSFWLNGGPTGGQYLQAAAATNGVDGAWVNICPVPANTWTHYSISLSSLGVANSTNLDYLWINNWSGSTQPVFYVADVSLTAKPAPALVHVSVNAANALRTVDSRMFAVNTAAWDDDLDTTNTIWAMTNMGNQALRWPGGSWGDGWFMTNEPWWSSHDTNFTHVATNTAAQIFFIANYGSGTPQQAADWVRFFEFTNHCYVKYWEIGNEVGGSWEEDNNTNAPFQPHDPWTYAQRFTSYYNLMKAVDPTIKIGAVADVTEDGTSNYTNHPVVNPVTKVTHNGWTPVMLTYMRSNGIAPDFLICHDYAPGDGDCYNLLWTTIWSVNAANLRMMLNDYLGTALASNVELNVTEFGPEGDKQWISLVGGLFYADNVGQIMQTEFNTLLWWDMRNGQSVIDNSDNALYGWRTNSSGQYITDGGCMNGIATGANLYPSYYCMKLVQHFARGGDTVLAASDDYLLLSSYAVRRTNGSLTLLTVNKSSYASLAASFNLAGYAPSTNAILYSYGVPQDDAARAGVGSMDIAVSNCAIAGSNFDYTFPPYSATVLALSPAPPKLLVPASPPPPGKFVFQLQGNTGVPYVIQSSTNLFSTNWTSISTNTPGNGPLSVTNSASAEAQFYRAIWRP